MRAKLSIIPTQTQAERARLVDEFGELDRKVTEFAPTAKRHKVLAEVIRSWYEDHPGEQPALAEGSVYSIQVSERGLERQFDLKARFKIFGLLGKKKASELFTVTLKAVSSALGESFVEEWASKERTGSRKLVAVLKHPAEAAA